MAVERVRGAKGAPWNALENDGKNKTCEKCGNTFAKKDAEEERQAGITERWQLESPEQVKSCNDTDCKQRMIKQGFVAMTGGHLEEHKKHIQKGSESHGMGL